MATIKDVANQAGVSISTVSNVLNDSKYVSPHLKKKVEDAIVALNYRVDVTARNMKKKNTKLIGVVISTLNTIFMPQVMNGIQSFASEHGYQLIFYCSDFDIEKEKQYISMLIDNKVDGIIIDTVASYQEKEYFRSLSKLVTGNKTIFVVSIERNLMHYGVFSIHVNNFMGGRLATDYLIEKGCRKIAVITGPTNLDIIYERLSGYKRSLEDEGIPYDTSLIAQGDYSTLSGYLAMKRLLLNGVSFDGVFSCNDQMAVGVIKALKESNIRIPEDVKIIGFDNTFVSSLITPSLSTINVPKFRMGMVAIQKCIEMIENRKEGDGLTYEIPINLIKRKTTDPNMDSGIELEW